MLHEYRLLCLFLKLLVMFAWAISCHMTWCLHLYFHEVITVSRMTRLERVRQRDGTCLDGLDMNLVHRDRDSEDEKRIHRLASDGGRWLAVATPEENSPRETEETRTCSLWEYYIWNCRNMWRYTKTPKEKWGREALEAELENFMLHIMEHVHTKGSIREKKHLQKQWYLNDNEHRWRKKRCKNDTCTEKVHVEVLIIQQKMIYSAGAEKRGGKTTRQRYFYLSWETFGVRDFEKLRVSYHIFFIQLCPTMYNYKLSRKHFFKTNNKK